MRDAWIVPFAVFVLLRPNCLSPEILPAAARTGCTKFRAVVASGANQPKAIDSRGRVVEAILQNAADVVVIGGPDDRFSHYPRSHRGGADWTMGACHSSSKEERS